MDPWFSTERLFVSCLGEFPRCLLEEKEVTRRRKAMVTKSHCSPPSLTDQLCHFILTEPLNFPALCSFGKVRSQTKLQPVHDYLKRGR